MIVSANGRQYKVYWRYVGQTTECHVSEHQYSEEPSTYAATVTRYVLDHDSRNKARRFSLAKLLREHFPHKPDRESFWRAYRAQLGHW